MPDGHDKQNGRMLFTDFDASQKGRPASVLPSAVVPGFSSALPTLADIISTLELDFEEDGETAPLAFPGEETARDDENPNNGAPTEDQAFLSSPDTGDEHAVPDDAYAEPSVFGPTWEEFAHAIQRGDSPSNPFTPPRAGKIGPTTFPSGGEDDDALDVLSTLALMAEEEFSAHHVSSPPHRPYGGVERIEGWYDPPENQPPSPAWSENWYEPPESRGDTDTADIDSPPPAWADGMTENDRVSQPTRRMEPATEKRQGKPGATDRQHPAHDTTMTLFADVDIEGMWEEKLNRQHPGQPADNDTRQVDIFNDLDMKTLWEERPSRPGSPFSTAAAQLSGNESGADETIIMASDDLRKAKSDALPGGRREAETDRAATASPENNPGVSPAADYLPKRHPGSESEPRAAGKMSHVAPPGTIPGGSSSDSDLSFLSDSNADEDEGGETTLILVSADGNAPSSTAEAGKRLPIEIAGETERRALALGAVTVRVNRTQSDSNLSSAERGEAGGISDEVEPKPSQRPVSGDEHAGDAEEPDYIPNAPGDAAQATKRGLTADDLLDDVDFSQYRANKSVSAPIIDDSAIDTVTKSRRPATEELAAIIDQGGAPEQDEKTAQDDLAVPEEPSALEDGATPENRATEDDVAMQGEDAADSVAVNPLDVFSNMDEMDFSDDIDDDMRELMETDQEEEPAGPDTEEPAAAAAPGAPAPPAGLPNKAVRRIAAVAHKVLPMGLLERLQRMIAWRENWWFYCDLAAAIIASASLAVIISYWFWYR